MKKTLVARMIKGRKTLTAWLRKGVKLAYHPGKDPKRPLPGLFFDLSVVGSFLFLVIGYLLS